MSTGKEGDRNREVKDLFARTPVLVARMERNQGK